MAKWVLQDVIDEHAMSPDALQQVIGLLKGYDAFGAAVTPTLEDNEKFHSFENKGIGGVLKLIGAGGASVFFAASDPTTPVPTVDNADPTIELYGPNNQPILTTRNSAEVHRKSMPAGAGNTIDATQVTSGVFDAARLPAAASIGHIAQFIKVVNTVTEVVDTGYSSFLDTDITVEAGSTIIMWFQCWALDDDGSCDLEFEVRLDGVSQPEFTDRLVRTELVLDRWTYVSAMYAWEGVSAGLRNVEVRSRTSVGDADTNGHCLFVAEFRPA